MGERTKAKSPGAAATWEDRSGAKAEAVDGWEGEDDRQANKNRIRR